MLASAVIALGASLKHTVLAEGIETQAQLDFLKNRDCEEGQGFYFSHPVVSDSMQAMLQKKIPSARMFANGL